MNETKQMTYFEKYLIKKLTMIDKQYETLNIRLLTLETEIKLLKDELEREDYEI